MDSLAIEFNKIAEEDFMLKDNIALCVIAKDLNSGRRVCVATSHLYYKGRNTGHILLNSKDERVKQVQAEQFLAIAKSFAQGTPMILCGDFNATPSSKIFDMTTSIGFYSVYHHPDASKITQRPYTSMTDRPKMVDYIFYSNQLQLSAFLPLPDEPVLLPNDNLSSDHIMIRGDFTFL